ncbi:CBS domain-containing protein [Chelatococcus asaccharovorans]|uniref:CBS domain protein n=1 Tax=Chelatococcus asaccharovorans TaxID=28210 RepID=A0A2V3TVU1_9HYPH|nr:CBS domain-containing protein [Chelatococcus asaccharovorans]MBS7706085.1 CBS domain-containing protein [Chelatococcus asaccharovorans]PXW52454.1 CBS domain protein [Chelatococcus asaccharovorans]CAH1659922.1 CBS domain protein [Chelatococcus asaccharovorans]CAH1684005.1 CBS domain protein [Chelatococcus asaccharovorans]
MKVADVMSLGAATVRPDAPVLEAAQTMLKFNISGLPVVDSDGRLVGMVTEGDLMRRWETDTERRRSRWLTFFVDAGTLAEEYVHSHGRKVDEVMTRNPVSATGDMPLADVVGLMEQHKIKRIPVLRDGKVAGIVSRANILRVLARQLEDLPQAPQDDLKVRQNILDEIARQGWLPGDTINVTVRDGNVELDGFVRDDRLRDAVRVAAENAPGVKSVTNNIQTVPVSLAWM